MTDGSNNESRPIILFTIGFVKKAAKKRVKRHFFINIAGGV